MNPNKPVATAWRHVLALLAALSLTAGLAGPAAAAAIYTASATASLRIVGISGGDPADLIITSLIFPPCACGDAIFFGNATASFSGSADIVGANPANLGVDDGADLVSDASGSVSPDGGAASFHFAEASIDLFNLSQTATFTIGFQLDWRIFADASNDDPLRGFAFAEASVFAESSGNVFHLDEYVDSDTDFGPFGPQELFDTLFFSVVLGPDSSDFVDVYADALGAAVVPAPASHWLMALGCLALALPYRRRRTNPAADSAP